MQFQVPQFIETEDKIVGPLTLKQFIYVGAGVLAAGLLYFLVVTWVWAILAVLIVGSAVAIAFIKVEGRTLPNVIFSAFNFYWKPQTYVWQPEHPELETPKKEAVHEEDVPDAPKKKSVVAVRIEKIAEGMALHKSWETLQTGEKISDKQFAEKSMSSRYEIFQKIRGDRQAARRIDYR